MQKSNKKGRENSKKRETNLISHLNAQFKCIQKLFFVAYK